MFTSTRGVCALLLVTTTTTWTTTWTAVAFAPPAATWRETSATRATRHARELNLPSRRLAAPYNTQRWRRTPCGGGVVVRDTAGGGSDVGAKVTSLVSEYFESARANSRRALSDDSASNQALVVGQVALFVLVLVGVIPVVGDALELVAGPGLILAGAALFGAGILELGPTNLSPSPKPVPGNALKTNGAYALSRHPMYAGILLGATGLSIATGSFQRLILTGLLYVLLDYKTTKEEEGLLEIHPAYPAYQSTVPKLLPDLKTLLKQDDYLALDDDATDATTDEQ